jgi:hypothetical protein
LPLPVHRRRNRSCTVPSLTATGTIARRSVERPMIGSIECRSTIPSSAIVRRIAFVDDPATDLTP